MVLGNNGLKRQKKGFKSMLKEDPLMKINTQGRVYDKKPATVRDIARDRDRRIWKAMCDNIEDKPSYSNMGRRFGCTAGTVRSALERVVITDYAKSFKEHPQVVELMKKRIYTCNHRKG